MWVGKVTQATPFFSFLFSILSPLILSRARKVFEEKKSSKELNGEKNENWTPTVSKWTFDSFILTAAVADAMKSFSLFFHQQCSILTEYMSRWLVCVLPHTSLLCVCASYFFSLLQLVSLFSHCHSITHSSTVICRFHSIVFENAQWIKKGREWKVTISLVARSFIFFFPFSSP